jgi:hypothetical protein
MGESKLDQCKPETGRVPCAMRKARNAKTTITNRELMYLFCIVVLLVVIERV